MSYSNNMFIKRKRERDCVCVSEKERFPEGEYEINNIYTLSLDTCWCVCVRER